MAVLTTAQMGTVVKKVDRGRSHGKYKKGFISSDHVFVKHDLVQIKARFGKLVRVSLKRS